MTVVIIAIIAVIAIWLVFTYNFFVSSKARIKAAVQEIGNQLKRQADLIPNLEEATKGYLRHEKGIFDKLTEARKAVAEAVKSGSIQKMADASAKVSSLIPDLRVVVEANPELKGAEVISKLMDELRDTADKVMYARRLLIDLTADFNVKRVSFPSSLVASIFKFEEQPGLITPEDEDVTKVKKEELKTPKISI